jgi:hypothetical protein
MGVLVEALPMARGKGNLFLEEKLDVIKSCERKNYTVDIAIATGIPQLTQEPLGSKMIN